MAFPSKLTKINEMLRLVIVNLIRALVLRGTAYFAQNNATIILPGDTRQATSELPS